MKKGIRALALLVIVAVLVTGFTGCTGAKADDKASAVEQTLVVGAAKDFKNGSEPKTLIFDSLTDSLEDMSSGPRLVTEWQNNADFTEFTLKLKEGVTFSNGEKFTAEVAKFNIEFWPVYRDCGYIKKLKSVDVVDDKTLKVSFNESYGNFIDELSKIWVTLPTAVDAKGNITDWTGTGPYVLQDYQADMSATLVRNETYWRTDKMPGITKIDYKVITDENSRVMAVKSGDVDVIGLTEHYTVMPFADVPDLQANKDLNVSICEDYGTITTYSLNWAKGVCADPNVRKAIALGIDRDMLTSTVLYGIPVPTSRYVLSSYKFSQKDEALKYDLTKAKAALEASGYKDSDGDGIVEKDGQKLSLKMVVSDSQVNRSVGVFLQDALKKIGIAVDLQVLDATTTKTTLKAGDFDMSTSHPWTGTVVSYLYWRGNSSAYDDYGIGYGVNDEMNTLTEAVSVTGDDKVREAEFDKIWKIQNDSIAGVPLYFSQRIFVSQKNIEGLKFCPNTAEVDLSDVVIK
ncbi:ABC transporter substrate-binding protein [Acetobacterium wieringae]|uniref:ABC transporter substrate-binding protein n=1 Tax=Acetobacterium wieringae TaxID=52694 RepID=A0ABY6HDE5_9FIRM|nr:ABC transporter substrate-binding protein [Acetobacterium wieringae]UYO62517.1 ABC transporter substrate-binding protein [Acetobacterium wieringae]VUZ23223.1 Nickel-binding periplasmic protein [Acetobacterium wieringae]